VLRVCSLVWIKTAVWIGESFVFYSATCLRAALYVRALEHQLLDGGWVWFSLSGCALQQIVIPVGSVVLSAYQYFLRSSTCIYLDLLPGRNGVEDALVGAIVSCLVNFKMRSIRWRRSVN
jgi:hypothetical protein